MHEHIIVSSPGVRQNFRVWDRDQQLEQSVQKSRMFRRGACPPSLT